MVPVAIIIGATYFGYFKLMEKMIIKDYKLFKYVFQKADLVEDFEDH